MAFSRKDLILIVPAAFIVLTGCSGDPAASDVLDVITGDTGSDTSSMDVAADTTIAADANGNPDIYPIACKGFDKPSGDSCTGTSTLGCCDTDGRVVWCQDNDLYCFDCKKNPVDNNTCGWRVVDKFAGYDCGGNGADPSNIYPLACGVTCIRDCAGRTCGDDGCEGSCGACENGQTCQNGNCADPGAEYPDVCKGFAEPSGGDCPSSTSSFGCCDDQGRVVWCDRGRLYCNDCAKNPAPQNSCGWFQMEAFQGYDCGGNGEDPTGAAVRECGATCQPDCGSRECGNNGCGGLCGTCDDDKLCSNGDCITPPGGVLTGTLKYEVMEPAFDEWDAVSLGSRRTIAAGHVPVTIVDAGGTAIGQADAKADGTFQVPLSKALAGGEELLITAGYNPAGILLIAVLKPKKGGDPGPLTSPMWAWTVPVSGMNTGTTTVTVEQGSGAIHIFRLAIEGMDDILNYLATSTFGLPGLALLWSPDAPWSAGLAYGKVTQHVEGGPYLAQSIFIGGGEGTSGPWAAAGVLHEFGHYLQNNFSRSDSPGGSHVVGQLITPPFAWAEAFSNFFGISTQSRVAGARDTLMWLIIDYGSGSTSAWWIDFGKGESTVGAFTPPVFSGAMSQPLDEMYLTQMIWDLWDGTEVPEDNDDGTALGTATVMETMVSDRFMDNDRAAVGTDYVDFVDAVLCGRPELKTSMTATIRDVSKFPYDGTPMCPQQTAQLSTFASQPNAMQDVTMTGMVRPPLQLKLAGSRNRDNSVTIVATVNLTGKLRKPPVLNVVMPDNAVMEKGNTRELLTAAVPGNDQTWRREFTLRQVRGPVKVVVQSTDAGYGAKAEATWPVSKSVTKTATGLMKKIRQTTVNNIRFNEAVLLKADRTERQ